MKEARAPRGRWAKLIKRIGDVGFVIAAIYVSYMVVQLLLAAKSNHGLEGQTIGSLTVQSLKAQSAAQPGPVTYATEPFDLSSIKGQKTVLVLWATWCGPCHSLLDGLKEEVSAGRLRPERVLAVSVHEPLADVLAFLRNDPLPFSLAIDPKGLLADRLNLAATPTVAMVDEQGLIQSVSTGGFRLQSKIIEFLQ